MGTILFTDSWGNTWERRSKEEDVAWNDITFINNETGWVIGEFGRIMRTTDGGRSWEKLLSPVTSSLMAIVFRDQNNGIVAGLNGVILKTLDGGNSWQKLTDSGTEEHLFGLTWDGHRWVCVGTAGILAIGDANAGNWVVKQMSRNDLSWHIDVACVFPKIFIVGGTQGIWDKGRWSIF